MPVSCRHAERQQERQTEPPERYETDSMTTIRSDLWNVIRPSYTAPEDYISKTLRPLRRYTEPNADAHLLRQCRATVTKLDFASGQPVDEDRPTLLRLLKTRRLERDIGRIKPWMQYDGFTDDYEPDLDSCLSEPRACLRNGGLLAKVLSVNIDGASGDGRGSLLDGTAWAVERFVRPFSRFRLGGHLSVDLDLPSNNSGGRAASHAPGTRHANIGTTTTRASLEAHITRSSPYSAADFPAAYGAGRTSSATSRTRPRLRRASSGRVNSRRSRSLPGGATRDGSTTTWTLLA